ncbi:hypothetical protein N7495_005287 [Penicillium taxi]|uniref:uncharacterized protein n=1 Tax=Penicillium taxi TaxID=168475 RepID=UPI0025455678|nr:uncharacterized protein N7495_005287 [Penicillium taxi]KAJ5893596.1 hypothetical protein N7495_005287 [Penicillium taxi]
MGPVRTVVYCGLVTELLQHLLDTEAETRLIICGTRTEFLVQLSAAIRSQRADKNAILHHDLLSKTIGLLASSSRIQLTFCPTLENLRAYMAVLENFNGMNLEDQRSPGRRQLLAILDAVALHATTSEFSAQGLSRTFAVAVETASRADMDLMLCECTNAVNPGADWGGKRWEMQVPILNGSVRIRSEESNWNGRGVSIKQVAQRWFDFDENQVA